MTKQVRIFDETADWLARDTATGRYTGGSDPAERFWAKVDKDGPVPAGAPHLGPCWEWTAGKSSDGYGMFWLDGRTLCAHRLAYEWTSGVIADGLTLDHLCRNPGCVRPSHLDPVTSAENTLRGSGPVSLLARKTHCIRGHKFTPENTMVRPDTGARRCRTCHNAAAARRRARRAA